MKNSLGRALKDADKLVQYDEHAKKVVSNKNILAEILIGTTDEFKGMSPKDVIPLIEGDPALSETPVLPGETNNPNIIGMSTESKEPYEGLITYDIRFCVWTPDRKHQIKIIVDIELQKSYYPGYDLVTRGILYGARMLSGEISSEFEIPDYDDIKKVYSIWICMNSPQYAENTMTAYSIQPNDLFGHFPKDKCRYDLMTVVMIRLSKKVLTGGQSRLHRLLGTLFSALSTFEEKKKILEEEYNIPLDEEFGRSVSDMCNVSQAVLEQGLEQGIQKGRVLAYNEFGLSVKEIADKIGISVEEVEQILDEQ